MAGMDAGTFSKFIYEIFRCEAIETFEASNYLSTVEAGRKNIDKSIFVRASETKLNNEYKFEYKFFTKIIGTVAQR